MFDPGLPKKHFPLLKLGQAREKLILYANSVEIATHIGRMFAFYNMILD